MWSTGSLSVWGLRHRFTTHTLRHLCLTHLARAGWSLQDLAIFAGHRNLQTTLLYVHQRSRTRTEVCPCHAADPQLGRAGC
jgi:integrase